MGFFGGLLMDEGGGGGAKKPPALKSGSHPNDETWHSYTLPKKEDPKNIPMNYLTHPLSSADITIFSPEISKFCYIKKYRYRLYFDT